MIQIALQKKLSGAAGAFLLDVNLDLPAGTFLSLYGKSGAGKTSILRMLAGLLDPDSGKITVGDSHWYDSEKPLSLITQKRKVGYVFQDYALFPNMTVLENLKFALQKGQSPQKITDLIALMELGDLQKRKPHTLSGGQQQRVALARALVQEPALLLLDEPLSAVDHQMQMKLQDYLLKVHQHYRLSIVLVSHNLAEIMKLSDQVAVLENGKIAKLGKPSEVFSSHEMSGKFQFTGELISMEPQGFLVILTLLIGQDLVKVIADEEEAASLTVGDRVVVASKAFNPIIKKTG